MPLLQLAARHPHAVQQQLQVILRVGYSIAARQWRFDGGRELAIGAHAQWFRTLGMDGEAMDASFVGLQQWSPLLGIGLSRHGSLAGVGLDARLSPRAMFKLAYDYEQGQYDSAHGMSAAVNVAF